jgi:hypothetical protein
MAYDQLDHLPDPYWIGAQICAVVSAAMGGEKSSVDDWMPLSRRPVRVMSGEAGKAVIRGLDAARRSRMDGGQG